jgi:hypothetical protein
MTHRLQMSPISISRGSRVHLPLIPSNREDAKFFRSWLVYDSVIQTNLEPRRLNWHMVLGLALATAVSASIWAGIGLMIARIWK